MPLSIADWEPDSVLHNKEPKEEEVTFYNVKADWLDCQQVTTSIPLGTFLPSGKQFVLIVGITNM